MSKTYSILAMMILLASNTMAAPRPKCFPLYGNEEKTLCAIDNSTMKLRASKRNRHSVGVEHCSSDETNCDRLILSPDNLVDYKIERELLQGDVIHFYGPSSSFKGFDIDSLSDLSVYEKNRLVQDKSPSAKARVCALGLFECNYSSQTNVICDDIGANERYMYGVKNERNNQKTYFSQTIVFENQGSDSVAVNLCKEADCRINATGQLNGGETKRKTLEVGHGVKYIRIDNKNFRGLTKVCLTVHNSLKPYLYGVSQ